jgi:hypothetical protein
MIYRINLTVPIYHTYNQLDYALQADLRPSFFPVYQPRSDPSAPFYTLFVLFPVC